VFDPRRILRDDACPTKSQRFLGLGHDGIVT
jgi:hypothetical protein